MSVRSRVVASAMIVLVLAVVASLGKAEASSDPAACGAWETRIFKGARVNEAVIATAGYEPYAVVDNGMSGVLVLARRCTP